MKNVLFILGKFYPDVSPNGNCCRRVMEALGEIKVNPYCIGIGEKTVNERIGNINIKRIRHTYFSEKRKRMMGIKRYIEIFLYILQRLILLPFWPLMSPILVLKYYREAVKKIKDNKINTIVCCYKPAETVFAGLLLKKKYPQIKLIVYFLDCMDNSIGDRFVGARYGKYRCKIMVKKFSKVADYLLVLRSNEEYYKSQCRDIEKVKIIDIPLLRNMNKEVTESLIFDNDSVNLVYAGTFIDNIRVPYYFLRLLGKVENEKKIVFHIFGKSSSKIDKEIEKYKYNNVEIRKHGTVELSVAYKAMKGADILVNFENTNCEMIPSKVFEYLGFNKPIINLFNKEDDKCMYYLKKYRNCLMIKQSEDSIEKNERKLLKYLKSFGKVDESYLNIEKTYYENTPMKTAIEINNIVEEK